MSPSMSYNYPSISYAPNHHSSEFYTAPISHHEEIEDHPHSSTIYHVKNNIKGDLSIKEFFEIALTALAFLSFGLFIIQLIINIKVRFKYKHSCTYLVAKFCAIRLSQIFSNLCMYSETSH